MEVCKEKEKINSIEKKQDEHEGRIRNLELSDATMYERMDSLIKSQSNLTGWVKALIVAIMISLATIFINNSI